MKLQIGDIVRQIVWGHEGQIMTEFNNYWGAARQQNHKIKQDTSDWLEQQTVPFTQDELLQRWFSVHCFDGGSILCCEGKLEFISRIDAQALVNDKKTDFD